MSPEPEKRSDDEIRADLALYERSHGLDEEAGDRLTQDIAPLLAELSACRAALTNARAVASDRLADRDKIAADLMAERDEARAALAASRADADRLKQEGAQARRDGYSQGIAAGKALAEVRRVEVSQLRANADKIAAIHQPTYEPDGIPLCLACGDGTGSDDWPCATYLAAVPDSVAEPLGSTPDQPATEENR